MKKNSINKRMYFVVACALLILISITFNGTYAFFVAGLTSTGTGTTTVNTKQLQDVVLTGNTYTSASNMLPGESTTFTFTVKNPNSESLPYTLYWSNVTNTFVNKSDLILNLSYNDGTNTVTVINDSNNVTFPTANDTNLGSSVTIGPNKTYTYTLTIKYKNTSNNQIADAGKTFGGTINLK